MTERDWTKADQRIPDPSRVVAVYDTGGVFCGTDERPFIPASKRLQLRAAAAKRKRAKKRKKALARAAKAVSQET